MPLFALTVELGSILASRPEDEKAGVLDSIAAWQICRTARNLAAHDYETDYAQIAEHFNTLHELRTTLYQASARFVQGCKNDLGVLPSSNEFADEFHRIVEARP